MAARTYRTLQLDSDVTDHILVLVGNCVDDWFVDRSLATDEFVDRLCNRYLNGEGFDIERMDTPAVRKIMRHARIVKRTLV